MRIAITMRVYSVDEYEEIRDALSHDWQEWLSTQAIELFPIPNNLANPGALLAATSADALILSGGNDLVSDDKIAGEIGEIRTRTEFKLISAAIELSLPIFGVCRGLQVINQYFGGRLTPNIKKAGVTANHVAAYHSVTLAPPFSTLAGKSEIDVNSYHNQGVMIDQLSEELDALATLPEDRLVEALAHKNLPIMAVQWHPERPNKAADFDKIIFRRLLDDGAFWQDSKG